MLYKKAKLQLQQGFTLIELMVVVTIMALLALSISINIASGRATRDMRLAVNRMVSEIRKVQGYTLSAKSLPNGELAQYYTIKFDLASSTKYTIQAIYDVSTQPKLMDIETIQLPPNVYISGVRIVRSLNPTTQDLESNCALISFASPFAKTVLNDGCAVVNPNALQLSDDYYSKIINFQYNVDCTSTGPYNPAICSASTDSKIGIYLNNSSSPGVGGTILLNGITGSVCPMGNNWNCALKY